MGLRASLMFADHLGSNGSEASISLPEHLANTKGAGIPADALEIHVKKVHRETRRTFDMLHGLRNGYPGLLESEMPARIVLPTRGVDTFLWQAEAAEAARYLCMSSEGGFFGCIISGTGSGKTRGAPTILANAAFGDPVTERRIFRISLGLGLRALATQSAREYVSDLGFGERAVSVLVGQPPIDFQRNDPDSGTPGSESLVEFPEWLEVEPAEGRVPRSGSAQEADWLRSLSLDTDRQLPACCSRVIEASRHPGRFRRLVEAPVLVGTVDHIAGVASPVNSRFLPQLLRVLTSDLILDEVDQYEPEDLAVLARLAYQLGAGGRRLIVMSATLTGDIAEAMFGAYREGWRVYAAMFSVADSVNVLCTGDAHGSWFTEAGAEKIEATLSRCREAVLAELARTPTLRRGRILPGCMEWWDLVEQVDRTCSESHSAVAVAHNDFRVSVGLVRMTRVSHTAAMAVQLRAGTLDECLRLKICLHSRFPRLHRAWLESLLKGALTRKGREPDGGVVEFCNRFAVFARAAQAGVRDIEIVVIASPVIETGNDLDFDYAIVDPVSLRSVIQTAGRVNRHRRRTVEATNVALLGRSVVAMESGRLERPGVETQPHEETLVCKVLLDEFPERNTAELAGTETFDVISARVVLAEEGAVPIRDAEGKQRLAMIGISVPDSPLARYISSPWARLSLNMTRRRKFRRSVTRDILFSWFGETTQDAAWHIDMAPGTRESHFRKAEDLGLTIGKLETECFMLSDLTQQAWLEKEGESREMLESDMRRFLEVSVPDYGMRGERNTDDGSLMAAMCYTESTGFTRGDWKDLFGPFGKRQAS